MKTRINILKIPAWLISIPILAVSLVFIIPNYVSAVTAGDWRAGRIIDDSLFYDNTTMSANEIQNFMNARVSSCDTDGTQPASEYGRSDLTHAQYAALRGWPAPPYICLRNYRQMPQNNQVISNFTTNLTAGDGSLSAAEIVKAAADAYSISPKALLATLQKESPGPLLSDTWPLLSQYKNAMGYGCPDTAPCDAKYEGFYNQMMNAAWQFKYYKDNSASFRYKPFQNNSIQYNPNAGCGASNVNIENYATAGLYNYTPYQPNSAALSNLYGSGDSCSAYGNRNFWRIYNDWFGTTIAGAYRWSLVSQTYTLEGGSEQPYEGGIPADAGDLITLKVVLKNSGTSTWYKDGNNPVRLATWGPPYRTSSVQTDTWVNEYRAAALQEQSVDPGQNGTFIFTARPSKTGNYGEYFNLVAEGAAWFPDNGIIRFNFNIHTLYKWQIVSQTYGQPEQAYNGGIPADLNEAVPVTIKLRNTGNVTWHNDGRYPVRIATWYPPYHKSSMYDSGWVNEYRPATLTESVVGPGEVGTFSFNLHASKFGNYGEYFNLVAEGISWFPAEQMLRYNLNVHGTYGWQIVSQWYGATEDPTTLYAGETPVAPGGTKVLKLVVKNIGDTTWKNSGDNPVRLATWYPSYRSSIFYDTSWISNVRVGTLQEASVSPGQNGTFVFTIKAPQTTGNYGEYFNLVAEGAAWFPTNGIMRFNVNVWP